MNASNFFQHFDTSDYSYVANFFNNLILSHFSAYYCFCIIQSVDFDVLFNVESPSMVITEDQQFLHHFQNGVDGGCQAFIVQGESTVCAFLDAFFYVHELSEQRTSSKKLVAVVENFNSIERICNHSAITELPDVLFVVWRGKDSDVQLFTTDTFSDGSRGSKITRIVPVADDNYFLEKDSDFKGVPIRMRTLDYPPFSYYEETVRFELS